MVRVSSLLLILSFSSPCKSEKNPFKTGILELVDKSIVLEGLQYLKRATMRCASLYELIYQLMSGHGDNDSNEIDLLQEKN